VEEIWVPIPGYEGLYSISTLGRVRSESRVFVRRHGVKFTHRGKVLKASPDSHGYPIVTLWKDNDYAAKKVHVLVALVFIGPRPEGMHVCHRDGKPLNCAANNLRYDTPAGNSADKVLHGTDPRGEKCGAAKLTAEQVREILASSLSSPKIAPLYGVCARHIRDIRQGGSWAYLEGR